MKIKFKKKLIEPNKVEKCRQIKNTLAGCDGYFNTIEPKAFQECILELPRVKNREVSPISQPFSWSYLAKKLTYDELCSLHDKLLNRFRKAFEPIQ